MIIIIYINVGKWAFMNSYDIGCNIIHRRGEASDS